MKTAVATKKEIEKKGAVSLADSLEIMTGVRVEDNCQSCNFTQVRINGMEGKYSQILINGMPVISALAGVYALEQIPANMIDQLEVVKGGGAALYGGNAVAGVVNVVTKEPEKSASQIAMNHTEINGEPNTVLNFNTAYKSKTSDTYATFFSNFQNRKPMDYNGDEFSDLAKLLNLSLGSSFSHAFDKIGGKIKLNLTSIFEDRRGGNKFDQPEHFADVAESIRTYRLDFGMGWEQTLTSKSILKFDSALSYTKRKSYYGIQQDPNAYGETENPVFFGSLTYSNFSLHDHAIVLGISYKSDHIDNRAPRYNRMINDTYTDLGFFLQDEIELIHDQMTLLVGVRGDKHSEIDRVIFSPRTSLLYKGIDNLTLRGTFSTGFRAPQVFDEDLHLAIVGGEALLITNGADLKEEKSFSFTLGADYGLQKNNRLYNFSFSAFYNQLNDVFTLREAGRTDNARIYERFNSSAARVYGVEVEAGFKYANKFEFFSGWTFQKSRLDDPEPDFGSRVFFRSPDVYGSVRMDFYFRKFLDFQIEMNYTGSMMVPHYAGYIAEGVLEKTDSFAVLNLNIGRKIGLGGGQTVQVMLSIVNIMDKFQKDLDKGVFP